MLEIVDLTKRFGGLVAIDHVSTTFERDRINAVIGPNGAGKTTFFNLVSGFHRPTSGRIVFDGEDVTGCGAARMAKRGVARTFQATTLFDGATVLDNLIVGHRLRTRSSLWDALSRSERARADERACRDQAYAALEFVGLVHLADRIAADITQEQRKRIAIALALTTVPKLLLLDEPAGGINPEETLALAVLIRKIVAEHITVCLVEHKMDLVMALADRIVVFDHGELIAAGTPAQIRVDPHVIDSYLGRADADD